MAFSGCIARPSSDLVGVDLTSGLVLTPLGTEIVDSANIHDPVSNNSRFTIPLALNGKYGIFTGHSLLSAIAGSPTIMFMRIQLNGVTQPFINQTETLAGIDGDGTQPTFVSTPLSLLTTNDFWELLVQNQAAAAPDTSVNLTAARTNFSLIVFG